jgi:hypothetical protein
MKRRLLADTSDSGLCDIKNVERCLRLCDIKNAERASCLSERPSFNPPF